VQTQWDSKSMEKLVHLQKEKFAEFDEYTMRNFHSKIGFLKDLASEVKWPLLCFGALVENIVQAS